MDMQNDEKGAKILPLSYGLSLLKQLLPVPTHIFKSDCHYYEKFDNNEYDDWNVFKTDFDFRCRIVQKIKENRLTIISDEKPVLYGGVACADDLILVIGPISITEIDQSFCKLYALKHNAVNVAPFSCTVQKLASILLLIHSSITGEYIYLSDFINDTALSEDIIENTNKQFARIFSEQSLNTRTHNPSQFEESIKNAITTGNVEGLKQALNSIYASMRGTLSRNSLRSAKNLAIVDITIATRAAIDAGLSVEEMYTISDGFIMEVEDCKYEADAAALAQACALRCTQKVAKYLSERKAKSTSLPVDRACQYIDHHINDKFDLTSMSNKLKISSSYLSKLFRQEKNMSIGDYIRRRKIEIAKMLLRTTDRSLGEIAMLLSFNSQSHFGRVFLKETGMTPAAYKNSKAIRDSFL
ncbi:helix-turn-helix transcriptional regulator [Succinivibrio sp.]|uniref:helix-turn-helix transcriptional regulator n=1 Tax=Succinivibrio sp. TaxID=2053619 RepID=UPI003869BEA8